MALSVDKLFKARDFVELKNISGTRIELTFKNPVLAILAKSKIQEIAAQCGPNEPFQSCELNGNDLVLTYDPMKVSERLLGEVFTGSAERAQVAAKELNDDIESKKNA